MLPKINEILEIDQIVAWQPLLAKLQDALVSPDLSYLNIWGSRGVGKTMFLELFHGFVSKKNFAVSSVFNVAKTPYALLVEDISKFFNKLSNRKKRKIVLLDHLDILKDEERIEFEKLLMDVATKRGSVIATSQAKLEWSEATVRNSSAFFAIQPLSKKDVEILSTAWGLNSSLAYELTFGHPELLFWLRENPTLNKSVMAERAQKLFLEGISPEGKELALFVSLFPGFDASTIQELLPANSELRSKSKQGIHELLSELLRAGLIIRDEENEYYYRYTDGAVRRLLGTLYREHNPEAFDETQRLAAQYFQRQAKYTGYLKTAFINVLYHLALSTKPKSDPGQKCLSWLNENVVLIDETEQSMMLRGWEGGNGDPSVIEEIKEIMGARYYKEIRSALENATSNVKTAKGELSHG